MNHKYLHTAFSKNDLVGMGEDTWQSMLETWGLPKDTECIHVSMQYQDHELEEDEEVS